MSFALYAPEQQTDKTPPFIEVLTLMTISSSTQLLRNTCLLLVCMNPVKEDRVDVVFHTAFLFWLNFYSMNTAVVEGPDL